MKKRDDLEHRVGEAIKLFWSTRDKQSEDCDKSNTPVKVKEPHFKVFLEFNNASYAKRYEIFLTKLVRERLYDGACLLLTPRDGGCKGKFKCPSEELSFRNFAAGLSAQAIAYAKTR